ncbi:hypothetical protein EVAR_22839_1 [Eumeta japonica]|uniref:Uncharacterized protein n=1 Tax=Eumeta variegata TaxID=151549 RepID=A0A4C1VGE2_EUMVA|nr:hypothetical protein EVAR_22839_1 [Eumeta japonica]
MRQNAVVLDYNENILVLSKKELHVPLVSYKPARTEKNLASTVMTCFKDWVEKNERYNYLYVSICNLALIPILKNQWKAGDLNANKELSFCQRDELQGVLSKYYDRFPFEDSQLGKYLSFGVEIKTLDEIPVHKQRYY